MCFFRKKKRRGSLPSTRNHGRDLDLELIGKTEEVVQVVEGDMSDVLDIGKTSTDNRPKFKRRGSFFWVEKTSLGE